ncbi:MAG: TonB-dependent receptor [Bacteroidetes bacterium]|nr:TonB-dependent receptor [Bacteroidota bacterium]
MTCNDESVDDSVFTRTESVPGVYFEYTYGCEEAKFGAIAGVRADYHNLFGWLYTPRVNLKYNFLPELIVRASAGRAYRTPNTYSDNIGLFVSAKELEVLEKPKMEDAWNGGVNLTARFKVNGKEEGAWRWMPIIPSLIINGSPINSVVPHRFTIII